MKTEFYLIVNENGSVKTRKTKPDLGYNEVGVKLDLNIPDAVFKKPHFQASIDVPEEMITTYPMDTGLADDIREVVKQKTGMELAIKIVDSHEDEQ